MPSTSTSYVELCLTEIVLKSVCVCVFTLRCSAKFISLFLHTLIFLSAFSDSEENPLNAYYLKCLENLLQQLTCP